MINVKKWIEYYDGFFPVAEGQVDFILNLEKSFDAPSKILSVECGSALLSKEFSSSHSDITVTDSYPEFINRICERTPEGKVNLHAFNINPCDISRYFGKDHFNIIFSGNHRLIFMKDRALIHKYFIDAYYLLSAGGYIIIDLINFSKFDFTKQKIDLPEKTSCQGTLYSEIIKDSDQIKYKLYQRIVTISGKVIEDIKDEEIIPVSIETIKSYVQEIGFSSIELYSDYKGTPYSSDSDNVICVIKK